MNNYCREVIVQLKVQGLSGRYPMKRKEKESFQEEEQNVQRLVVKKSDPQHAGNTQGRVQ